MKIATIILRVLMGALFLFASITILFGIIVPPEQTGAMKIFDDGMKASRYLMPTVKVIELLCGLCFVTGFFVPLATLIISPIIVNIVLVHAFLAPEGLPAAIFLVIANCFVAYSHKEIYTPFFKMK